MGSESFATLEAELLAQAVGVCRLSCIIVDMAAEDLPIVYVNDAFSALTGYQPEETIGRNCRFLQNEHVDQPGIDVLRQAVKRRKNGRAIVLNYRKDGTSFLNEVIISPLRSKRGRVTHFAGFQHPVPHEGLAELREVALTRMEELSGREREVFQMLVGGQSNKTIAGSLGISSRTVEKHRQRVMRKMRVSNIVMLTRLAIAAESDPSLF